MQCKSKYRIQMRLIGEINKIYSYIVSIESQPTEIIFQFVYSQGKLIKQEQEINVKNE